MTARYGNRTEIGNPVTNWGRGSLSSGGQLPYVQTFTSPGTWTWPGKVTHVEVLLVGGGGGSGAHTPFPSPSPGPVAPTSSVILGSGGGGGVRLIPETPVSGPVPVTVGAGGSAGTTAAYPNPSARGGAGGDSSFGPLSVGGGAGGGGISYPTPLNPLPVPSYPTYGVAGQNAPPTGGGAGGNAYEGLTNATYASGGTGGSYGVPQGMIHQGAGCGAGSATFVVWPLPSIVYNMPTQQAANYGGQSRYGYGAGGDGTISAPSIQNSGQGARGQATSAFNPIIPVPAGPFAGYEGGSGVVIVRWWE